MVFRPKQDDLSRLSQKLPRTLGVVEGQRQRDGEGRDRGTDRGTGRGGRHGGQRRAAARAAGEAARRHGLVPFLPLVSHEAQLQAHPEGGFCSPGASRVHLAPGWRRRGQRAPSPCSPGSISCHLTCLLSCNLKDPEGSPLWTPRCGWGGGGRGCWRGRALSLAFRTGVGVLGQLERGACGGTGGSESAVLCGWACGPVVSGACSAPGQ